MIRQAIFNQQIYRDMDRLAAAVAPLIPPPPVTLADHLSEMGRSMIHLSAEIGRRFIKAIDEAGLALGS